MRTVRITLVGGPYDGEEMHVAADKNLVTLADVLSGKAVHYRRSENRTAENRQVFQAVYNRTLKGLRSCDLG